MDDNVFALTVFAIKDDKSIEQACVMKIVYNPETQGFLLAMDQDQVLEFIDYYTRALTRDSRKEVIKNGSNVGPSSST